MMMMMMTLAGSDYIAYESKPRDSGGSKSGRTIVMINRM